MAGSFEEAENRVPETLLRAWRGREALERDEWFRAWLYRIAENACLVAIERDGRRVTSLASFRDVPGCSRIPTGCPTRPRRRTRSRTRRSSGARRSSSRSGRSSSCCRRASGRRWWLSDVLGWSAREEVLEIGVAAGALELIAEDIRITMPPHPYRYEGRDAIARLLAAAFGDESLREWRLRPTRANRQPAAASRLRRPGDSESRAFELDVLRVRGDRIVAITTFDATLFEAFGLPPTR